jgi:ribonuclease-3 family protein
MKKIAEHMTGTLQDIDPKILSPLVLAYLGDACFELYIRSRIVKDNNRFSPDKLHHLTVGFVKASSQSDIVHGIWELLNEEEKAVVKRGRNAKSGAPPKNADIVQYRYATGFEALIGYLFMKGDTERLMEVLDMSYRQLEIEIN